MSYGIYLGMITKDAAENDTRLRVRILPHMEDIKDEDCPYWPFFFKDQAITGKAGDLVWTIAGDSFDVGYILGYANYFVPDTEDFITYKTASVEFPLSPSAELRQSIKTASIDLMGQELDLINVKIVFWNENAIHFIDRASGAYYMAFSCGTIYAFMPDGLKITVQGGAAKMSLNADGCGIKTQETKIQSKKIGLGLNPAASVLVTTGESGEEATTSEYVKA